MIRYLFNLFDLFLWYCPIWIMIFSTIEMNLNKFIYENNLTTENELIINYVKYFNIYVPISYFVWSQICKMNNRKYIFTKDLSIFILLFIENIIFMFVIKYIINNIIGLNFIWGILKIQNDNNYFKNLNYVTNYFNLIIDLYFPSLTHLSTHLYHQFQNYLGNYQEQNSYGLHYFDLF